MDNNVIWSRVLSDADSSYNADKSNWQDIYDWIALLAHGEVLDVGCGLGHLTKSLLCANRVHWVKGVDVSSVAVEEARRRQPDSYFVVEDIEHTTRLQDGHYDCACFTQVLEHIKEDRELVGRIPQGKDVFISVPKESLCEHESHVNFFNSVDALRARYGFLIDIQYVGEIGKYEFLCLYGKRNSKQMKHTPKNNEIYLHCVYTNSAGETSLSLSDLARRMYLENGSLAINSAFFNLSFKKDNWYDTIFPDIEIVRDMHNKLSDQYKDLFSIKPDGAADFDVLIREMKSQLKEYFVKHWDSDAPKVCFHSAGYDSRIISGILTELRHERGDEWIGDIHFRCHQPEERAFIEIMKMQGWGEDQYSVWENSPQDHYNIGRVTQVLNGFSPITHQMDFSSDILPDGKKKDTILIMGFNGGEFFNYYAVGNPRQKTIEYCQNPNINRWLSYFSEEGEWVSMYAYEHKELLAPFLCCGYLKVASLMPNKYVASVDPTLDTVRKALLETMSINTLAVDYGHHKYTWGISQDTKQEMISWYKDSKFYKAYGIEVVFDNILNNITGHDGKLWAFSLMYEKVFA